MRNIRVIDMHPYSASAFFVTATLRRLAHEGERTLIAAIHQPGSETFDLFDSLFLLSGGRTVYFGDREMASEVLLKNHTPPTSFLHHFQISHTFRNI